MAMTRPAPGRLVLTGCFALALAAGPALALLHAADAPRPAVTACVDGESEDDYTSVCTPDVVPNSPEITETDGGLPEIDGIPCTGRNSGQCIGLGEEEESETPLNPPHPSVGSSPTVTGSTT